MKCLNLTDGFSHIPANWRGQHLISLNDPIGIYDKPATIFDAGIFIIHPVRRADPSSTIGEHGIGYATCDHLFQFMFIPHFVNKNTVHAHGKHFNAKLLELWIMIGDRRYFGCSNKGKITWIETEHDPFSQVVRKFYRCELALVICGCSEIWSRFTNLYHFVCLPCRLLWCLLIFRGVWLADQSSGGTGTADLRVFRHKLPPRNSGLGQSSSFHLPHSFSIIPEVIILEKIQVDMFYYAVVGLHGRIRRHYYSDVDSLGRYGATGWHDKNIECFASPETTMRHHCLDEEVAGFGFRNSRPVMDAVMMIAMPSSTWAGTVWCWMSATSSTARGGVR